MNGDDDSEEMEQSGMESDGAAGVMPMAPSAPPVSAPPTPPMPAAPQAPPMRPVVGGAPLTGYPGFDASIIAQKRAQLAEQDKDFARYMMQNARIQDAQKATDMAIRFLSMRKYGRDVESAVAAGMDPNRAAAMAAARNPTVFGGGAGAASFIKAVAPLAPPQQIPATAGQWTAYGGKLYAPPASMFPQNTELVEQTVGNRRYVRSPKTGAFRPVTDPAVEAQRNILAAEIKDLSKNINVSMLTAGAAKPGSAMAKGFEEMRRKKAELERQLAELDASAVKAPAASPASAPATPSRQGVSGTILPLPASKKDLEVNALYKTAKGVGRWTGDHFEKVAD